MEHDWEEEIFDGFYPLLIIYVMFFEVVLFCCSISLWFSLCKNI